MNIVKIDDASKLGKLESHAAMVRLVRQLQDALDEAGMITGSDITAIDNVVYTFLAAIPSKVRDEVSQG